MVDRYNCGNTEKWAPIWGRSGRWTTTGTGKKILQKLICDLKFIAEVEVVFEYTLSDYRERVAWAQGVKELVTYGSLSPLHKRRFPK